MSRMPVDFIGLKLYIEKANSAGHGLFPKAGPPGAPLDAAAILSMED